jgi:DNA repair protein RecN (Recombination protein N)
MIRHISIQDFAIIKELNMDLHPGLNIITGQTGAGKSIIIEAISMALGSRADTDYVRTGAEKANVTMIVDTDDLEVDDFLEEAGIPPENPMVIQRQISAVGKSVCRINGNIVALSALNKLCKHIADIHGQYDHQSLLNTDHHIELLDLYGKDEISPGTRIDCRFFQGLHADRSVSGENKSKIGRLGEAKRVDALRAF